MASSTVSSRAGSSARSGTLKGMPASRILALARPSRLPIAAGDRRKAEAMPLGVEAENHLEHQRRVDRRVEGGMGAGEEEREALIRYLGAGRGGRLDFFRQQPQRAFGFVAGPAAPGGIDQLAAGDGDQPPLRFRRHAVHRPVGKRRGEGVGQGVLGRRHVARPRGEQRHQPAVAVAGDHLGGGARRVAVAAHGGAAGCDRRRTSTTPWPTVGHCAAQASAASSSATSMMKVPPSCSGVSA